MEDENRENHRGGNPLSFLLFQSFYIIFGTSIKLAFFQQQYSSLALALQSHAEANAVTYRKVIEGHISTNCQSNFHVEATS